MENFIKFIPNEYSLDNNTDYMDDFQSDPRLLYPDIPWLSENDSKKEIDPLPKTSKLTDFQNKLSKKYKNKASEKFIPPVTNSLIPYDTSNKIIKSIVDTTYSDEDKEYLIKLADRESSYNPTVVNKLGYKGLYQFGKAALETVGYTADKYMSTVENQHDAAIKLAKHNENQLKSIMDKYVGKTVNGIKITKNGLRAAAHLLGANGVKKYFATPFEQKTLYKNVRTKDLNKVGVEDYLKLFQ